MWTEDQVLSRRLGPTWTEDPVLPKQDGPRPASAHTACLESLQGVLTYSTVVLALLPLDAGTGIVFTVLAKKKEKGCAQATRSRSGPSTEAS